MRTTIIAILGLATGSLCFSSPSPSQDLALRDIGVHDPSTQRFVLALRSLDDEKDAMFHGLRARGFETELYIRAIATEITNRAEALLERRSAIAEALAAAEPAAKGGSGGGGKGGKPKNPKDGSSPGGGGGSADLPGLSPEGQKAQKQCNDAQKNQGDCGAMIGMFATMGW